MICETWPRYYCFDLWDYFEANWFIISGRWFVTIFHESLWCQVTRLAFAPPKTSSQPTELTIIYIGTHQLKCSLHCPRHISPIPAKRLFSSIGALYMHEILFFCFVSCDSSSIPSREVQIWLFSNFFNSQADSYSRNNYKTFPLIKISSNMYTFWRKCNFSVFSGNHIRNHGFPFK